MRLQAGRVSVGLIGAICIVTMGRIRTSKWLAHADLRHQDLHPVVKTMIVLLMLLSAGD